MTTPTTLIIRFCKDDDIETRKAELRKVVEFYSKENGYRYTAQLIKKDFPPIDDFAQENIMFADGCEFNIAHFPNGALV